jgi:hypothetical protein
MQMSVQFSRCQLVEINLRRNCVDYWTELLVQVERVNETVQFNQTWIHPSQAWIISK